MEKNQLIKQLMHDYIAKAKTGDALKIMSEHEHFFDTATVVLLTNRWANLSREIGREIIGEVEKNMVKNQINSAIFDFLESNLEPDPKDVGTNSKQERIENFTPDVRKKKSGKILLTSVSPRRKQILEQIGWTLGIEFFVHPFHSNSPENHEDEIFKLSDAKSIVKSNAREKVEYIINAPSKADPFTEFNLDPKQTVIIGIDTIVFCDGKLIDRPLLTTLESANYFNILEAEKRAYEMLKNQRGKEIHVLTGIYATFKQSTHLAVEEVVETTVLMREYTDDEIWDYIETFEPIDKAGAFGIQGKGISLMKSIKGDYYNVVGLPLITLQNILSHKIFKDLSFDFISTDDLLPIPKEPFETSPHPLTVFSIGDINYDFVFDRLPENFFHSGMEAAKVQGSIHRGAGGTAVQFAKGAKKAGFKRIYVVGVYGRDELGREIESELEHEGFEILLGRSRLEQEVFQQKTGIAIILRDVGKKDFSLTITDAIQSLPPLAIERLMPDLSVSDVIYCSGYCVVDNNRKYSAQRLIRKARSLKKIVLLDVVKDMDKRIGFSNLKSEILTTTNEFGASENTIDVLISEFREIFRWLEIDELDRDELSIWEKNKDLITNELKTLFKVVILRSSDYAKEIILNFNYDYKVKTIENDLDYPSKAPKERLGYSDRLTAKYVYDFLSPRVLLASKSPQRLALLTQVMDENKIIVSPSEVKEKERKGENVFDRVQRLALEKAYYSMSNNTTNTIEFIIGADTEIAIENASTGDWEMIPHPGTDEEAIGCLKKLSGRRHTAITGLAIIYVTPEGKTEHFQGFAETKVAFRSLDDDTIAAYVQSQEPIGRAGGYAIQGKGAMLVERIEGSYSNVVGLPLELLLSKLAELGKGILDFDHVSNWTFSNPINFKKDDTK